MPIIKRKPHSALAVMISCVLALSGCATSNSNQTASDSNSAATASPSESAAEPEETTETLRPRPTYTPTPIDAGVSDENAGSSSDDEEVSQSIDYTIVGGCQGSYEAIGYYGIFEEFADDCFLVVEVYPPNPARFAQLQYMDGSWTTESSGWTDGGVVYLEVDTFCESGNWCDGTWDYRVFVDAEGSLPSDSSATFEFEFIPWE